jgi:hypothetical protein
MSRGVLYMTWGDGVEGVLQRSIASLKKIHPELPYHVLRAPAAEPFFGLMQKTGMLDLSPFDETLFLDADTVVLDRLDYGFEKARRFDLACCICEVPWAARYLGLGDQPDMIEYNTGVLFFSKKAKPVFDAWGRLAKEVDATIYFRRGGRQMRMPFNDQCGFAAAVEEAGISPFVLPLNWNLRAAVVDRFFGPIKIWHSYDDVPPELAELGEKYRSGEMVIQEHRVPARLHNTLS